MTSERQDGAGFPDHASTNVTAPNTIALQRVDVEAPWRWLAAGWTDLVAMPVFSLTYGAIFVVLAVGLLVGLVQAGWQSLILALAGGFLLIGPVLAVGLYEASRRRQAGLPIRLRDIVSGASNASGQLWLLGFALMLIYMIWIELAFFLFMLFFSVGPFPPLEEFVPRLLFSWQGVTLLAGGTIVGAVLATLAFSISVISAPMLMERPLSVAGAIFMSVRAVRLNIKPMALWAALIAGFSAVGIATLCIGLIVVFPLIGHATWHAYRDIVKPA